MQKIFLIGLILLLSACSATGPKFRQVIATTPVVKTDMARLYFYRNDLFTLGGRTAPITINDIAAGNCDNAGFFYVDVMPGAHRLKTELPDFPGRYILDFMAEAAKTYYLKITPRDDAIAAGLILGVVGMAIESGGSDKGGAYTLTVMDEVQAVRELVKLAYSGAPASGSESPARFGNAPSPVTEGPAPSR